MWTFKWQSLTMINNIAAIEIPERNSLANLACQNVSGSDSFLCSSLSKWSNCFEPSLSKNNPFGTFWTSTLNLNRLLENEQDERCV